MTSPSDAARKAADKIVAAFEGMGLFLTSEKFFAARGMAEVELQRAIDEATKEIERHKSRAREAWNESNKHGREMSKAVSESERYRDINRRLQAENAALTASLAAERQRREEAELIIDLLPDSINKEVNVDWTPRLYKLRRDAIAYRQKYPKEADREVK